MEKPKLLIADPSEDFRNALMQSLQGPYSVRCAYEGLQALKLLQSFQPDILVLDLMLPGLDGITLLQKAAEHTLCPNVLATTRYLSDYMLEAAQRLHIGYIMIKPCDCGAVAARISDLSQSLKIPQSFQPDPKTLITNSLLRLGIPTKLRGYGYLRESILLMLQNPNQSITKELYPAVAKLCNATSIQIERSIRSAITAAWEHKDHQIWQLYFPTDISSSSRPTNATFICRLADHFRLKTEKDFHE